MTAVKLRKASQQMIVLFIGIIFISTTQAQVLGFGACPSRNTVENFDVNAYAGRWYEYSKYPFVFELFGKCITADYGLNTDGTVSVVNNQINELLLSQNSISGTARVVGPGKLQVRFANVPDFGGSNYWVLGTDYSNYSVVYSCSQVLGVITTTQVWILTREREPSTETVQAALNVLNSQGVSTKPLQKTNQQNCG